jgi:hypothetical protein
MEHTRRVIFFEPHNMHKPVKPKPTPRPSGISAPMKLRVNHALHQLYIGNSSLREALRIAITQKKPKTEILKLKRIVEKSSKLMEEIRQKIEVSQKTGNEFNLSKGEQQKIKEIIQNAKRI